MANLIDDRIVRDFATPVNVSTLTVLFSFNENLGERLIMLYFAVVNLGANAVTVILEGSEDGSAPSAEPTTKQAAPGQQVEFAIEGAKMLSTKWRLSAQTDSPGFPTTAVKWRIKGQIKP